MSTEGYVYILEISTGRVKVGFTTSLKNRLATHAGTAKAYGATIERTWTSPLHKEARPNEAALITFCRSQGGVAREGEYFAGISFDDVAAFAERELTITVVAVDETARERRKAQERAERSRILDRFEERTEFTRRRVHGALDAAGIPAELRSSLTWLSDPSVAAVVGRLEAAEHVDPREIRAAFGLGGAS